MFILSGYFTVNAVPRSPRNSRERSERPERNRERTRARRGFGFYIIIFRAVPLSRCSKFFNSISRERRFFVFRPRAERERGREGRAYGENYYRDLTLSCNTTNAKELLFNRSTFSYYDTGRNRIRSRWCLKIGVQTVNRRVYAISNIAHDLAINKHTSSPRDNQDPKQFKRRAASFICFISFRRKYRILNSNSAFRDAPHSNEGSSFLRKFYV